MPSITRSTIPSREQLLYYLVEAAEIEHNLMCSYLYAAFSLKRSDPAWSAQQREAVERWWRTIQGVALEEMTHLCLVSNLLTALGSEAHLRRPPFPIERGPYPSGFVMRLQGFSVATISHFEYVERPSDVAVHDHPTYDPTASYLRGETPLWRLSPGAGDYATVGELYARIEEGLRAFAAAHGETALFLGPVDRQVDATMAPLPGVRSVTDLSSALAALDTIVAQGEGSTRDDEQAHFRRFGRVRAELVAMLDADPTFAPAWSVATSPVMNAPPTPEGKVHLTSPDIVPWLDVGNAFYTTSLRLLSLGLAATTPSSKRAWLDASFELMRCTTLVGRGLAARPATTDPNGPSAGLTFTPLRTLAAMDPRVAPVFMAARLRELEARARELPVALRDDEPGDAWRAAIETVARLAARVETITATVETRRSAPTPASATTRPAPPDGGTKEHRPEVERVRGRALTVLFQARRCIHSRHCVLETPDVFLANTPSDWIRPDADTTEHVIEIAHRCPSGAIRYERHDGGPEETAPPVNTLHVRESGPYALRGEIRVHGAGDGFRMTLCRCGASKRKPYCDGSHAEVGFRATGEPTTGDVTPLAIRNGPLEITPTRDGPLAVRGNLEICAGTGRSVARVQSARLCRCGGSGNKPFCDGTHRSNGFVADGE